MKRHFYNSRIAKVPWFIRRFGVRALLMKPIRSLFGGAIIRRLPEATFDFGGKALSYFYHTYNNTWINERAIEVPIGMKYVAEARNADVLEIGNVLSHYYTIAHTVLDKYETGPDVVNADIIEYTPPVAYDLIISISTFEHIGFDDESTDRTGVKISLAIQRCRSFLKSSGKLVITVPVGYNPELDQMLASGALEPKRQFYFRRIGYQQWAPAVKERALECVFAGQFPYANAIAVLEFDPLPQPTAAQSWDDR